MQDLGRGITRILTADVFKQMLASVKDQHARTRLIVYSSVLLRLTDTQECKSWLAEHPAGSLLSAGFEEGRRFAGLVSCLLSPHAGDGQLDDVRYFVDYAGSSSFAKSIKAFLKTPEARGPGWTQLREDSRKVVQEAFQDAMRVAGTSAQALPVLQKLQQELQASPRELAPGCCCFSANVLQDSRAPLTNYDGDNQLIFSESAKYFITMVGSPV